MTPDGASAEFDVAPHLLHNRGTLPAGVLATAADEVALSAAARWLADRGTVVGTTHHTDVVRPSATGTLTATATPVQRGRTQQLWQVEVVDGDGHLVSRSRLRMRNDGAASA